ncbi:hypothetical protein IDJ81_10390 [Tsuneonella flava]|uniref:Lipoprotein n=1 Tax=Tsuneonella flava TaxID=2055955 RepID=A0ABX7K785_9SPHN|nr:hypothetical protein [Tsuneonella flava]QSB43768.1 hypothetical protein IDJ81_10390 [Tsuneonella flava]
MTASISLMSKVALPSRLLLAIGMSALVAGCGSDSGQTEGGAESAAQEQAASQPAAPGVDERAALIAEFHEAAPNNCLFYKEEGGPSEGDDLAGSPLLLCSGRSSPTENYGLAMLRENGTVAKAGTVFITMGPNGASGAFDPVWSLVGKLAGMTAGEEAQLRMEMPSKLRFAGNLYSIDYEPLMTTASGVPVSFAGNKLKQGMLTLRIDPSR